MQEMRSSVDLEYESAKKKTRELLNLRIEALQDIVAIQDSIRESLKESSSKKEKKYIITNR